MIFNGRLLVHALLLLSSQNMRRALTAQSEWESRIMVLAIQTQTTVTINQWLSLSQLPLLFVKLTDDSTVLKLFSHFPPSPSTHLQGESLTVKSNCESCWQQSNGVSKGQKVGVGNLGDWQTIEGAAGRRREEKEEGEAVCRQSTDHSGALVTS